MPSLPLPSGPAVDAADRARRVMIASGNAVFRHQLLAMFAGTQLFVIEAEGGADALLKLEHDPCSSLVVDRQLPDLDAEEFAGIALLQDPALDVELLDSSTFELRRPVEPASGLNFETLMHTLRATRLPAPAPAAGSDPLSTPARPREHSVAEAPVAGDAGPARLAPMVVEPEAEIELAAWPSDERGAIPAPRALLPGLIGNSLHLGDLSALVQLVAPRRTTVLLLGETGTGKEVIAQALHECSGRAQRPCVVVNCAAIPEALLESELFGYVRGAFTGAVQSRTGRIVAAHGGTLFLDEIGEMPLGLQAKLLRFLQTGELQRLGSNDPQRVDVRVVAATNVDLLAAVEAGRFRRDLYYRLAVFPIELQPLRQRPDDVFPLALHFLEQYAREAGVAVPRISASAQPLLERYAWPGNVRELQHVMERAFILANGGRIEAQHLPALHMPGEAFRRPAAAPVEAGPALAVAVCR